MMKAFPDFTASRWIFGDSETKVSQLATGDFTQYIALMREIRQLISTISTVPLHYLVAENGGWPSGESLKSAEAALLSTVRNLTATMSNSWADVLRLCLHIEGMENVEVEPNWLDTAPRNEQLQAEVASIKHERLGVPLNQVQSEMGYSARQIDQFKVDRQDDQDQLTKAFDRALGEQLTER